MKTKLLFFLVFFSWAAVAQPQITGDTMLCPYTNGTATVTNDMAYDSYAWYFKYWFSSDEFQLIEGETGSSFTYDWFTYDQALIKVVVTLNGETFESNTIQIDSYNWLPISMGFGESENISINPENGNVMLCAGTSFTIEVFNPFNTNIRWYRDGVMIEGANSMTYEVSAPGTYHVTASPGVCPENESSTEGTPIVVEIDNNCNLATPSTDLLNFSIYPNPAADVVTVVSSEEISHIELYNAIGQKVAQSETARIDVSGLASGVYIMRAASGQRHGFLKIVRK